MSIKQKDQLMAALAESNNQSGIFTKSEVMDIAREAGLKNPMWFFKEAKVGRNQFNPMMVGQVVQMPKPAAVIQSQPQPEPVAVAAAKVLSQAKLAVEIENLVPAKDSTYVPFGFYRDLVNIVKSGMFYPTFICGLSGNGKTMMVEQVCAKLKREAIRVNISIETDEDDLIGRTSLR